MPGTERVWAAESLVYESDAMSVMDSFLLDGRTGIVTGAAGLLGSQFSHVLAESGANVVLADLNVKETNRLAESLHEQGIGALSIGTDVTDPKSVHNMVATVLDRFGRVDILVNSAAEDPKFDTRDQGLLDNAFEGFSLEVWNRALAVNLTGLFLTSQAVVRPMLEQEGGVIINLCSTYGLVGPDQRIYQQPGHPKRYKPVYYSVTKAGVLGLTRYLATYYAGKGIRVNALTPGGVFSGHDEEFVRQYSARTVLGRMARPDELNAALLFLASDASSYMTGANLVVDGGWTAW